MMYSILAHQLASPKIAQRIIEYGKKHPYHHIDGYMERYWLFNGTDRPEDKDSIQYPSLPSLRLHHILRADRDRNRHDHPFNARTFILSGWYEEERDDGKLYLRVAGTTATIRYGEFHRITRVAPDIGAWTIFATGKYQGPWGFLINGNKVLNSQHEH